MRIRTDRMDPCQDLEEGTSLPSAPRIQSQSAICHASELPERDLCPGNGLEKEPWKNFRDAMTVCSTEPVGVTTFRGLTELAATVEIPHDS